MPPAQRGSTGTAVFSATSVANPTTLTPVLPAHQIDDLLLVYTACRSATPTVATPSGWTALANVTGTNGRMALFGKVATSAAETNPAVVWSGMTTGNSGTPAGAQASVWAGMPTTLTGIVDVTGAVENAAASTFSAATGAAITTLTNGDLVIAMGVRLDDTGGTWAPPANWTIIGSGASTSGSDMSLGWMQQVKTPAGSVAATSFSLSGSSFASSGVRVALKALPPPTATSVARVSLAAPGGDPDTRTAHSIKVRARKASGSGTVILSAALYEGSTNRSGDLATSALTTSLADYTLAIPDASAANITDYSNLELRFWANSSTGDAVAVEVAQISLVVPYSTPPTPTETVIDSFDRTNGLVHAGAGAAIWNTNWIKDTGGLTNDLVVASNRLKATGSTTEQGHVKVSAAADCDVVVDLPVGLIQSESSGVSLWCSLANAGTATASGYQLRVARDFTTGLDSWTLTRLDSNGSNNFLTSVTGQAQLPVGGSVWLARRGTKLTGYRRESAGGSWAQVVTTTSANYQRTGTIGVEFSSTSVGSVSIDNLRGGPLVVQQTLYGATALPVTYGSTTAGSRKAFGQVAAPFTVGLATAGLRKAKGIVAAPFTFGSTTAAQRRTTSALTVPFTFGAVTAGQRLATTHFGAVASASTFGAVTQGQRKALGVVARATSFGAVVQGQRKAFSSTAASSTFGAATQAQRRTFGSTATPVTFGAVTAGQATAGAQTYYGVVARATSFDAATQGQRKAFGVVARASTFGAVTAAQRKALGVVARATTFGAVTAGQRKAFGQVARATNFAAVTAGQRKAFGAVALPATFAAAVQALRRTFSSTVTPVSFGAATAGVASTPGPAGAYFDAVMADNPISYWRLGSGTTIHDEKGVSPDVTASGGASTTGLLTANANAAVAFDGVDDGVSIPNNVAYQLAAGSVEIWLKTANAGAGHRGLLVKEYAFGMFLFDNQLCLYDWSGGGNQFSTVFLNDDVRHHVVLTFQSGVAGGTRFYVDGVAVGPGLTFTVSSTTYPVTIANNGAQQFFAGVLDEAAIYGSVLSPARIAAHYQVGSTGVGPTTHYGSSSLAVGFGAATAARRRTTSAIAAPTTFGAVTSARRRTTSTVAAPFGFGAVTQGRRRTTSAVAVPATFGAVVQGRRRTTSSLAMPSTFGAVTQAQRRTTGVVARASTFGAVTAARKQTYGAVVMPVAYGAAVKAKIHTRSALVMPLTVGIATAGLRPAAGGYGAIAAVYAFGATTQARRKTFGQVARPSTFGAVTQAKRRTTSGIVMPVGFVAVTAAGRRTTSGLVLPVSFAAATQAQRRTFGRVAMPLSLALAVQAQRRAFGQVALPLALAISLQARRDTFAVVDLPLHLLITSRGRLPIAAVVLNDADMVYLSGQAASEVAVGAEEVWPE